MPLSPSATHGGNCWVFLCTSFLYRVWFRPALHVKCLEISCVMIWCYFNKTDLKKYTYPRRDLYSHSHLCFFCNFLQTEKNMLSDTQTSVKQSFYISVASMWKFVQPNLGLSTLPLLNSIVITNHNQKWNATVMYNTNSNFSKLEFSPDCSWVWVQAFSFADGEPLASHWPPLPLLFHSHRSFSPLMAPPAASFFPPHRSFSPPLIAPSALSLFPPRRSFSPPLVAPPAALFFPLRRLCLSMNILWRLYQGFSCDWPYMSLLHLTKTNM